MICGLVFAWSSESGAASTGGAEIIKAKAARVVWEVGEASGDKHRAKSFGKGRDQSVIVCGGLLKAKYREPIANSPKQIDSRNKGCRVSVLYASVW